MRDVSQTGWSREYIEKLVAEEQSRADLAAGRTEYTYNTEVRPQNDSCMHPMLTKTHGNAWCLNVQLVP